MPAKDLLTCCLVYPFSVSAGLQYICQSALSPVSSPKMPDPHTEGGCRAALEGAIGVTGMSVTGSDHNDSIFPKRGI